MQRILSLMRQAMAEYNMIQDGDKIAVGISGGKDSIALVTALANYQKFSKEKFQLVGININVGFEDLDLNEVEATRKYLESINVPFISEPTNIKQIVWDERHEANPCSLCAKMRRGALNTVAIREGCNKLALGHHADDVLDTFFLSLIYEGRISTFPPKSYMSRTKMTLIRPMVFVEEKLIKEVMGKYNFPIIHNPCPEDKHTQRENVKDLINLMKDKFGYCKTNMLSALFHPERNNLWDKYKNIEIPPKEDN